MSAARRFLSRLRALLRRDTADAEAAREIASHLRLLEDEGLRRGLAPAEAARAARLALGGVDQTLERHRDSRSWPWLEDLRHDIGHSLRGFRRAPAFTAAAVTTLALGIGATTAVFSVVHALLLTPLPYATGPGDLVRLVAHTSPPPGTSGPPRRGDVGFTVDEARELAASVRSFTALSTVGTSVLLLRGVDGGGHVSVGTITPGLFDVVAARPMLGRSFDLTDLDGARDVVLVSHRAWTRFFASDPALVGRTLTFETVLGRRTSRPLVVIGIMPPSFAFPTAETQFWVLPPAATGNLVFRGRLLARLHPDVTLDAAFDEVAPVVRAIRGHGPEVQYELAREADEIVGPVRPALLALSATVAVLLVIACLNVTNLLLARQLARQHEWAVRIAVGASRSRVIRQTLTESAVLGVAGGVIGTVLAVVAVSGFQRLATTLPRIDLVSSGPGWGGSAFPRLQEIAVDPMVLAFTLGLSFATGLAVGFAAAVRAGRAAVAGTLRAAHASSGTARGRQWLVAAQVGGAMTLLVSGLLLTRSLDTLLTADTGFVADRALTFQVALPTTRYPDDRLRAFSETVSDRLRGLPGVSAVAFANQLPLVALRDTAGGLWTTPDAERRPAPDAADARFVSADYFAVLGIPVLDGRGFEPRDGAGQPRVLLINEALARRQFPGMQPIAMQVHIGRDLRPWTIVGVAGDVRQHGLDRAPEPQFFVDLRQWTPGMPLFPAGAYYLVKTSVPESAIARDLRSTVATLEPEASIVNLAPLSTIVRETVARPRLYATLVGGFALLGVLLAGIGVYGVLAYLVQARTAEFGVRLALGASPRQLLGLVIREGGVLVGTGLVLGTVGALALSRLLAGLLIGVSPQDPSAFVSAAVAFAVVAAAAVLLPARRATRIDPLAAIRSE